MPLLNVVAYPNDAAQHGWKRERMRMKVFRFERHALSASAVMVCAVGLASCSMMGSSGPSTRSVMQADHKMLAGSRVQVVDVTDAVARRILAAKAPRLFSESLGDGRPIGSIIGRGDVLDIAIWEAPPATLFGSAGADARMAAASTPIARGTSLPEQMVDGDGRVSIPFAGNITAAGRSPQEIARDITNRLKGKAHEPQVIVRLVRNSTANVTVIGDVANSVRMPLTAKGERLLDALASAGGVRQPVGKMTVQVTRGARSVSLPLEAVVSDPRQNIRLQPDDVVTALFQPYSFTAFGATGASAEVPFEGTGITLVQALGRVGGLQDFRADARGVFIFRMEDPAIFGANEAALGNAEAKIPVIYRIDMKNPQTLFVAQNFPVNNKDVVYVSNAPLADFQKFLNIVSSVVYPIISVEAITNNN